MVKVERVSADCTARGIPFRIWRRRNATDSLVSKPVTASLGL